MKKGMVLEGGGVKGAYQIGSFYAFRDCHIKLDGFVGTSIGSFNACMLASHHENELLNFWYNVNPGLLFGFDKDFVDLFNEEDLSIKGLIGGFNTLKEIIKNNGLENLNLKDAVSDIISYEDLMKSRCDFGLVTCKLPKFEPIYIYKEDIKDKENLLEYLIASCYFPGFKERRIIDNSYYVDGGLRDNSPVRLLSKKGYKKVYVINIKGIGFNRSIPKDIDVVTIRPSRNNGKIFELNMSIIRDNIKMGYYDSLRVLKKLDGYKYCFKKRFDFIYDLLVRKIDKKLVIRVSNFFNTHNNKELVIKALEYAMEKDGIDYYDVYNPIKIIKDYRYKGRKHFVYKFLSQLRFF
ncbi:MAG: patatin-like phospholipase family protein [Candidatus Coprovivens sp.]